MCDRPHLMLRPPPHFLPLHALLRRAVKVASTAMTVNMTKLGPLVLPWSGEPARGASTHPAGCCRAVP